MAQGACLSGDDCAFLFSTEAGYFYFGWFFFVEFFWGGDFVFCLTTDSRRTTVIIPRIRLVAHIYYCFAFFSLIAAGSRELGSAARCLPNRQTDRQPSVHSSIHLLLMMRLFFSPSPSTPPLGAIAAAAGLLLLFSFFAGSQAAGEVLTSSPTSSVKGKAFNRFVAIWLENTDYAKAAGDR